MALIRLPRAEAERREPAPRREIARIQLGVSRARARRLGRILQGRVPRRKFASACAGSSDRCAARGFSAFSAADRALAEDFFSLAYSFCALHPACGVFRRLRVGCSELLAPVQRPSAEVQLHTAWRRIHSHSCNRNAAPRRRGVH